MNPQGSKCKSVSVSSTVKPQGSKCYSSNFLTSFATNVPQNVTMGTNKKGFCSLCSKHYFTHTTKIVTPTVIANLQL